MDIFAENRTLGPSITIRPGETVYRSVGLPVDLFMHSEADYFVHNPNSNSQTNLKDGMGENSGMCEGGKDAPTFRDQNWNVISFATYSNWDDRQVYDPTCPRTPYYYTLQDIVDGKAEFTIDGGLIASPDRRSFEGKVVREVVICFGVHSPDFTLSLDTEPRTLAGLASAVATEAVRLMDNLAQWPVDNTVPPELAWQRMHPHFRRARTPRELESEAEREESAKDAWVNFVLEETDSKQGSLIDIDIACPPPPLPLSSPSLIHFPDLNPELGLRPKDILLTHLIRGSRTSSATIENAAGEPVLVEESVETWFVLMEAREDCPVWLAVQGQCTGTGSNITSSCNTPFSAPY